MAKILEFSEQGLKMSVGYYNLKRLIDEAKGSKELNLYEDAIDLGITFHKFLPSESEELTEQLRKKRLELARPKQKAPQEVTGPGLYVYCPEMGESRPECQIIAKMGHYGTHYYIDTLLTLKGRGITFMETREAKNLTASGQFLAGWNRYKVTERAFQKLQEQYSISMDNHFD